MKNKNQLNYLKIVEWSEEDDCYIGTSPGLFEGGVHGDKQEQVFHELCEVVEDIILTMKKNGKSLHKAIAIHAMQNGESINKLITHQLEAVI